MKMKFAKSSDEEQIFKLWHKEKKTIIRIFGLTESINNKEVFVYKDDNSKVIGFVRFNLTSSKTNDYIKINEVFINTDNEEVEKIFFDSVNGLVFMLGYTIVKVTDTIEYHDVLVRNGFELENVKTKISSDESYPNLVFSKEIKWSFENEESFKNRFGLLLDHLDKVKDLTN